MTPDAIDPHLLDVVREGAYWTTAPYIAPLQNIQLVVRFKQHRDAPKDSRRASLDVAIARLARKSTRPI